MNQQPQDRVRNEIEMLEVGIPMFLFPFFIKVICKVTLSTPCLWASFHPLSSLSVVSAK
jgi:hypothetical protein